jgi:iron(III) transport system ATP-binding protein
MPQPSQGLCDEPMRRTTVVVNCYLYSKGKARYNNENANYSHSQLEILRNLATPPVLLADPGLPAESLLTVKSVAAGYDQPRSRFKFAARRQHSDTPVLNGLSFSLERGTIGCLLGPSGCGKTTALRAIAGFLPIDSGQILLDGRLLSAANQKIDPEHRGVGVVFQDFALFPHLTVRQNIGFGLSKAPKLQAQQRIDELLSLAAIEAIADRFPHELSGGQQQRVALARALAPSPDLLLMDEPFSSLDPDLRERLAQEVRTLLKAARTTALLVTHDQHEAFAMADRIGVMRSGRIEQWDTPYALYHQPASEFVADFVGQGVLLRGQFRLAEGASSQASIKVELGSLPMQDPVEILAAKQAANSEGQLRVLLRPDDVEHDDDSLVRAQVLRKAFRGAEFIYTLRLPSGAELLALVPSHHNHDIGENIGIRFNADHVVVFPLRV